MLPSFPKQLAGFVFVVKTEPKGVAMTMEVEPMQPPAEVTLNVYVPADKPDIVSPVPLPEPEGLVLVHV